MNDPASLVSIVIPVYMTEKYLPECIESVMRQTYKNTEIILVDDGSPDKSGIICDEYADRDSRIKVIHKQNEGVAAARNDGIDAAKGSFICFVDSDDSVKENYVEAILNAMLSHDADIVTCGYSKVRSQTREASDTEMVVNQFNQRLPGSLITWSDNVQDTDCKSFYDDIMVYRSLVPWNKLYRMDIIKENGIRFPKGIRMGEDQIFNARYIRHIKRSVFLSEVLYIYNDSDTSVCRYARTSSVFDNDIKVREIMLGMFTPDNERYNRLLRFLVVKSDMYLVYDNRKFKLGRDVKELYSEIRKDFGLFLFSKCLSPRTKLIFLLRFISPSLHDNVQNLYRRITGKDSPQS